MSALRADQEAPIEAHLDRDAVGQREKARRNAILLPDALET